MSNSICRNLFAVLNSEAVVYAVMRNAEKLPNSTDGSDVDLLVERKSRNRSKRRILEAIGETNGTTIGTIENRFFFQFIALGSGSEKEEDSWWGLRIDVNVGLSFKGQPLIEEKEEIPTKFHNGISVLPDGLAGVLGVLKEALNNGIVPQRYLAAARKAAEEEWPEIERLLAPMGSDALARLREILLVETSQEETRRKCRRLKRAVLLEAFTREPIGSMMRRIEYEWSKVRRVLDPPGIVIAILGVDGTGKTTIIEAILPVLNAATHNAVFVRHLRPGLLPPLSRLRGRKAVKECPVIDPHGSTPGGVIGSLLRMTWLASDYVVGYWLLTRPAIAKQPAIVLYDRYAYDMALDPRRFRIGLPSRVAGWFAALAPKPDIVFCLTGEPAEIAARKGELSPEETRRQLEALRAFAAREPRAVLIETGGDVEATRDRVLEALCDFLRRREAASKER